MTATDAEREVAVAFFFEHAGFSYVPEEETADEGRLRGATQLAKAEEWAKAHRLDYRWEPDWDDSADGDVTPDVREQVIAYFNGDAVASLGSIGDATDAYRRVVEAELAFEARAFVEARSKPEEPDMRAHRLAECIVALSLSQGSQGLYNDVRNVLIAEFADD